MYLFFFNMALGLNDFDGGKSITRATGRGGPENRYLFGPKWNSLRSLPEPSLSMNLLMHIAHIKSITSRAN
jgi:hypothetical protein